ncbi:phenolic acid decarboxylase [Fructilactobacillus myrtifloralis]|uniref:phenolic acid decarboxylase n=1 Tax=Fructilactobacillus myrtifloralis TaxID=2940301 RepID=UPI00237C8E9E|nr:phenolic acid decarboxylase [Fructilactobacillus myrtifloralis]
MPETINHLNDLVGMQLIYTYANGWDYELYVKNATTIDYRIHSGMVGGRWVKDQPVELVELVPGVFKMAWTEPTGTDVSLDLMPNQNRTHGVIFFPKWVDEHPEVTVCFQNDHLQQVEEARDHYPTYPKQVVSEFSDIIVKRFRGVNDETVIDRAPEPGMIEAIREQRL